MKLSKIALATTMALSAMSAHAVSTGIPASPTNVVFISGASGIDGFMQTALENLITVSSKVVSPNATAWYGATKAAWGTLTSGSNVLIIKRSAGGSAMGVIPLGKQTKIGVPNWSDGTLVSGTTYSVTDIADNDANIATLGLVPDLGVSDVEPNMFRNVNVEFGYTALSASQFGALTAKGWSVLAEGIVATKVVPDTYVLSNTFMREALSGHYRDWSYAGGSAADKIIICRRIEGSGTQAAYNSYFNGVPDTQTFNGYQNTMPATMSQSIGYNSNLGGTYSGVHAGTSGDPIAIDPSAGFMVAELDGSGDVRKCLQAAQQQIDVTLKGREGKYFKLAFSKLANPGKAIGILSVDSYTKTSTVTDRTSVGADGNGVASSNTDATGEYTFRFLNGNGTYDVKNQSVTSGTSSGVAPSRTNILSGAYDFVVEPTLQYKTTGTKAFITNGSTGFFKKLMAELGNPAFMEAYPSLQTVNSAPYAYVALPSLYTKTNDSASTRLVADLVHEGNTTAKLHVPQN